MQHFLLKTEPSTYSIDDLARDGSTSWGGVRNYQARNIIREMKAGDYCVVYHSSCAVPAAVGLARVTGEAYPDPLQFDRKSEYFDPSSKIIEPRWLAVDIRYVSTFEEPLALEEMKKMSELRDFRLLERGNRLSVFPMTSDHFSAITGLLTLR